MYAFFTLSQAFLAPPRAGLQLPNLAAIVFGPNSLTRNSPTTQRGRAWHGYGSCEYGRLLEMHIDAPKLTVVSLPYRRSWRLAKKVG